MSLVRLLLSNVYIYFKKQNSETNEAGLCLLNEKHKESETDLLFNAVNPLRQ